MGTLLLVFSIRRGSGALKGLNKPAKKACSSAIKSPGRLGGGKSTHGRGHLPVNIFMIHVQEKYVHEKKNELENFVPSFRVVGCVYFFFCTLLVLSTFWTSRGHRCRPFFPPVLAFNFYRA